MSDWFDGAGTGKPVDVLACLSDVMTEGISALVSEGALVSIGTTSDGGALSVTVTVDGRWRREYFRDEVALGAWIAEAIPAVRSARGSNVPPAGNGQRTRRSRGL